MSPKLPDLTLIELSLSTKKQEIGTDCLGLGLAFLGSANKWIEAEWVRLFLGPPRVPVGQTGFQ